MDRRAVAASCLKPPPVPCKSLMRVPGARVAPLKTFRSKRLDGFNLLEEAYAGGRIASGRARPPRCRPEPGEL